MPLRLRQNPVQSLNRSQDGCPPKTSLALSAPGESLSLLWTEGPCGLGQATGKYYAPVSTFGGKTPPKFVFL